MDEIASKLRQSPSPHPHGIPVGAPAPFVYALAPGLNQADGAGSRKALLFALRAQIADIVPRAATGSTAMPQPAASPAAAGPAHDPMGGIGGMAASPSVCPFSSPVPRTGPRPLAFGIESIDGRLPAGGFAPASLNEFKPDRPRDAGTALTLALTLAARAVPQHQPLLLVLSGRAGAEHGLPYGPGLTRLGLDPKRLLIAEAPRLSDALWTIEEALRSGALAAVVGLMDTGQRAIGMMPARRLVLAADEGGTPCVLLTGSSQGVSVAHSRWRVGALPSAPHPLDANAPGARRCVLKLERCRHGPSGLIWNLEWRESLLAADDFPRGSRPPAAATLHLMEDGDRPQTETHRSQG